ncbi:MAG: phosphatase [Ruminococcaceae bacterium]|nr:phosphatase [Oscillospiraceae bacterium]
MIKADLHTHTIACTHAYSTISEIASYAKKTNIEMVAITDHTPGGPDSPHIWHFRNMQVVPRIIDGVKILRGAETNIMNPKGEVDLPKDMLEKLDIAIASFHNIPNAETGTKEEHTNAYINLIKNPNIDILGHTGSTRFEYDIDTVIKTAKEYNKIIEINNATFNVRKQNIPNCIEIAKKCKQYGVLVAVNSDAHICYQIGNYDNALGLLKEIEFPTELIINTSAQKVIDHLNTRTNKEKIVF